MSSDFGTLDGSTPTCSPNVYVRGLLAPAYLLDYLRFFVLFEEDGEARGGLVKKIAGYHQFHAVRECDHPIRWADDHVS